MSLPNKRLFQGITALALLSLLPSILAISDGKFPFGEDALSLFGAWRMWTSQSLHSGILPLWNPHLFVGMPFMSNGQTSVFYPPNVIYWFLPTNIALLLDALLHSILLGYGGYLLARSLSRTQPASALCGICLMLGNGVAAHLYAGHMTWHASRAYLPLIIWALVCVFRQKDIRYVWAIALFLALQVFAGYPPYVLWSVCWCLVFTAALWRIGKPRQNAEVRRIKLLPALLPVALLFFLAAAVVLPLRETNRQGRTLTYENAVKSSSTMNGWVRLALPNFFGGNQPSQWSIARFPHEEAAYIGLLPLGLALFSPLLWRWRREKVDEPIIDKESCNWQCFINRFWWILPLALVMALGRHTPLYPFLFDNFPPLRLFRVPARWFEIWYFAACILAAFGWDALFQLEKEHIGRIVRAFACLAFLFAGVAGVICFLQPQSPYWMEVAQWNDTLTDTSVSNRLAYAAFLRFNALQSVVTGCVLALVLAWALNRMRQMQTAQRPAFGNLLLAIIVAELLMMFWMSARYVKNSPPQNPWTAGLVERYHPGDRWNTAFQGEAAAFGLNLGLPHNIDLLGGYDTMAPRSFFEFVNKIERRSFWSSAYQAKTYDSLWSVASITHVPATSSNPAVAGIKEAGAQPVRKFGKGQDAITLWKMPPVWPRVFVTGEVIRQPREQQLAILSGLAKQNKPSAVIDPAAFSELSVFAGKPGKVKQWQRETNRVLVDLETTAPQILVVGEANAPGWRAWINGREQEIQTANYLFRSVVVPEGSSRVVFVYDNQTYRSAVFLSLCGLTLLAGAISFVRCNRRHN